MRFIHWIFLLLAGVIVVPGLLGKPGPRSRKPTDNDDIGQPIHLQMNVEATGNLDNRRVLFSHEKQADAPKRRSKSALGMEPKEVARILDERPQIYRIGHLPAELPGWFAAVDRQGDCDGQIGLDEWVKFSGKTVGEFEKVDLNQDGVLTAEEYLKFKKSQTELTQKQESIVSTSGRSAPIKVAPQRTTRLEVRNGLMVPTTGVDDDDDLPAPPKQDRPFRLRGRNGVFKQQSR